MSDIQIFQVLWLVYFAFGVGIILDKQILKKMLEEYIGNTAITFVSALLAILMGYLLIISHNIWEANFTVIITIIGWIAFFKGILLLIVPKFFLWMAKYLIKNKIILNIVPIIIIILGIFCLAVGFLDII